MQERYAVTFLLNFNVIVKYSAVKTFKLVELVVMRSKDSPRIENIGIDYVFDNGPCDRKAVV